MTRLRNQSVIKKVLARDFGLCRCCGFKASEVHHVIPLVYGGEDTPKNMISLCSECHQSAPDTKREFYYYMLSGGKKTKLYLGLIAQQAEIAEVKSGGEMSFAFAFNLGKNVIKWCRQIDMENSLEKYYRKENFEVEDVDFNDINDALDEKSVQKDFMGAD